MVASDAGADLMWSSSAFCVDSGIYSYLVELEEKRVSNDTPLTGEAILYARSASMKVKTKVKAGAIGTWSDYCND
jgi:hypothetical protein